MTNTSLKSIFALSLAVVISGCGSTNTATSSGLILTPVENIDATPLKISDLTTAEKNNWGHLDLVTDTIPGMSVDKAYAEIIKNKKGTKTIVAVLDSGIDLDHEDLDGVLWTNTKEKPGNGIDDDGNGYIDDIHGYNFLGESYNEQLEYVRMLRLNIGDAATLAKAKTKLDSKYNEALQGKEQYESIYQAVKNADADVRKYLKKDTYTKQDLATITATDETMQRNIAILNQMFGIKDTIPEVLEELNNGIKYYTEQLNYNLNKDFNGRESVGDDPYDFTDVDYGNGNPMNRVDDESHGTHVAGIIGAERNNGIGVNGVANNVAIMSIRAVPNGDEYDKDIARGIRYAVDNGARIINGSFGKSFSPNAQWVYDAIKYAADNNVLFVHAAGNDGADLDNPVNANFPNDQVNNGPEIADNVITVGALNPKYGSELVASYSNYGKINVDIFAPGTDIYSTYPNNDYEYSPGTSMAAPGVAGVAALVMSQYPSLTAAQVKKIILQSGLPIKTKVVLGKNTGKSASLDEISTSGKIANAYNALVMASKVAAGQIKL
ncbi:MAG TPA: peptidase S8 [Maribacter sp.]|uniref:S8 family peptidase n=1 Tax=unclassified Maribacter TaxID=2615042 RepID=UPI000EC9FC79|nr:MULTISPECIES: S8 family peptidase [unclassified Maribacter]HAF76013.1 peptidase S8 [Maribacter sp.]|tara:strand:- start:65452 stop:67101 length:1650 start_codon:yes stop_codon:yes gene_type:complete